MDNLPAAVAGTDGADLPCFADGRRVPPLLYADDLLLLSTSPAGLQRQLDHLEAYSAAWGLTVNAAKTEVVVFEGQRGGKAGAAGAVPAPLPTFTCGDATLDIEETFKYLGVQFHCRNAFSGAAAARAAAGGRAVHSLHRRCAELGLGGEHGRQVPAGGLACPGLAASVCPARVQCPSSPATSTPHPSCIAVCDGSVIDSRQTIHCNANIMLLSGEEQEAKALARVQRAHLTYTGQRVVETTNFKYLSVVFHSTRPLGESAAGVRAAVARFAAAVFEGRCAELGLEAARLLLLLYHSLVDSTLSYCAAVWAPGLALTAARRAILGGRRVSDAERQHHRTLRRVCVTVTLLWEAFGRPWIGGISTRCHRMQSTPPPQIASHY